MTDVLGVCLSWSDEECVVQPESGPAVTIPLVLIVSGKPVPPRPSVRLRVSAREAALHVASLFPGISVEPLGEWLLRTEPTPVGRLRRRANSCLAFGDSGLPFDEAVSAIREFYDALGRDRLVQVELGSDIEAAFVAAGWEWLGNGDAHFQLASLSRVRRALGVAGTATLRVDSGSSASPSGDGAAARATAELSVDGDQIARGQATLDGDWLGIHDLEVDPSHQRRGHARDVLATLLEWGAEQGATTAWLHVETDNEPAQALYESVGFQTHHTCRYLRG